MKRLVLMLSALLVAAYAIAQGSTEGSGFDPALWFSDPAVGTAAVVGLVEWLRKKWPGIDGPLVVPGVALVSGAVVGGVASLAGIAFVEPFASFAAPINGISYGLAVAVTAVLGVNVFDLLASKLGKALIGIVRGSGETVDPDPRTTASHDARIR